ncbi:glycoside hydrolase family 2 protein [Draconibacterium halophilum]|uniref:glycoside hydrolase family 2 protein n=1 Tax=Draconibacterium halophilum TaxID=2706887 RepID=UPI00193EFFE1|nr:glycoside hydrolase family 2 TIM barrel-domain containing protein [Draconibacterium halophilum]
MNRIQPFLTVLLFLILAVSSQAQPETRQVKYLSGTDNENTETWEFYCTAGRNSGQWSTIEVPSHWEQQGFGNYDYGRDYRTYGKKFRYSQESGLYRYNFDVPGDWKEKTVFIVFEGSMTDTEVKINSELAGPVHQGSFYRFRYDISDKLKFGETNQLEVKVDKWSANHSVNRAERYADYWIFGGIFRPVYLEASPQESIDRVAINAESDGTFEMDVFPLGITDKQSISTEIIDAEGNVVQRCETTVNKGDSLVQLSCDVNAPKRWTAETPNLYTAKVQLKNGGDAVYELTQKFGFRTIEIRQGDGIYLNGVKIKLKGVNRHVFWPETGRCVNPSLDLQDVKLMKEMNMNSVRCAHYPPDQAFLDYCDSLGLYVLDELAGWQNAYDTESGEKLVRELVIRDVNHPSIIFWSNGNEGGTNTDLDNDYAIYDPSNRPVIHAHHRPGNDYNGIDCNHYENYYSSKKILDEGLIYLPTEFLHSQDDGGGAAGLSDFWELFWYSERSAGGFTWVFSDEGIVRTDLGGKIDVNRVNAPDGILGPHREKEGSYYAMREIYSPVKIFMEKLPEDFNGTIELENRYHFTNLNKVQFNWELVSFSWPQQRGAGHKVMKNGRVQSPDVAPTQKGELKVELPDNYKNYDVLYLRAFDPAGEEIFCWSWKTNENTNQVLGLVEKSLSAEEKEQLKKLKAQGVEEDNILPISAKEGDENVSATVELKEDEKSISLKSSGIGVTFSKENGTILTISNDFGLPIPLNNGPVLVSGESKVVDIKTTKNDDGYKLEFLYEGDLKFIKWTMYNSGWLQMDYEYQVEGEQYFTGISFDFPESDVISAKWLGKGPSHVWKNRLKGGRLDVFERLYNNVLPGTNTWDYPQFKGYFADVSWMEFNTVYGKFTVVVQQDDLFVRLFDFYGISGPKNYPELPLGNISFLDGIPPIGTKLAMGISNDTWNLGPEGKLNVMEEPVKRTLYFYFGLLQ